MYGLSLVQRFGFTLISLYSCNAIAATAAPIQIVLGINPTRLEREAAVDLATTLQALTPGIEPQVTQDKPTAKQAILLGNHTTNPHIPSELGANWPELGDQGFLIQPGVVHSDWVIIGGNTAMATWWGAQAYLHQLGFRSALQGDLPPRKSSESMLVPNATTYRPRCLQRAWHTWGISPVGFQTWNPQALSHTIRQLSKLRFNHLVVDVAPWHPFVSYQFRGVQNRTTTVLRGEVFPIDAATVGKKALQGAHALENSAFRGTLITYQQGHAFLEELMRVAHDYGMSVSIELVDDQIGNEFASVIRTFPKPTDSPASDLVVVDTTDPTWVDLLRVQAESYCCAYPQLAGVAWRGAWLATPRLSTGETAAESKGAPPTLVYQSDPATGILPQPLPRNSAHLELGGHPSAASAAVRLDSSAEANVIAAYLAQLLWDGPTETEAFFRNWWGSLADNPAAVDRLWKAEEALQRATDLIGKRDPHLAQLAPNMLIRQLQSVQEPLDWSDIAKCYADYTNELYRAHGAIEGPAKGELYYHAKRGEFASEFMAAILALRAASTSKSSNQADAFEEAMDSAVEAVFNAITALADAARDPSDRALIAVLNAYAYRPVLAAQATQSEE